jgi:hypothetical protein
MREGNDMGYQHEETNLAVMENKLKNQGEYIHSLATSVETLRGSVGDLLLACRMTQTSQAASDKKLNEEIVPRVNTLWDNQNKVQGGWSTMSQVAGWSLAVGAIVFAWMHK